MFYKYTDEISVEKDKKGVIIYYVYNHLVQSDAKNILVELKISK